MRKIAKLTVGGAVAVGLTLGVGGVGGVGGVAFASPSTSSGNSTTTPSTSSGKSTTKPSRTRVLTGNEIWRIVEPSHPISCTHVKRQLQRTRAAVAAAAKRLSRWQTTEATDHRRQSHKATKRTNAAAGKVRGFQKLQHDGQALIQRIDAKCSVTAPAAT